MAGMTGNVRVWAGAVVGVLALVVLGVYLGTVGLDKADKWASVIGLFVAVAGIGIALYSLVAGRHSDSNQPGSDAVGPSGDRSVTIDDENSGISSTGDGGTHIQMRAEASGHGSVYQAGGDQNIDQR